MRHVSARAIKAAAARRRDVDPAERTHSLLLWTMLRVRCLRGGSRGAEAAHLIGAMVGIVVVSSLLFHVTCFLDAFIPFFLFKHMPVTVNKESMFDMFFTGGCKSAADFIDCFIKILKPQEKSKHVKTLIVSKRPSVQIVIYF